MGLVTNDEAIFCKAFPSTLSDKALTWFTSLKPITIDSLLRLEKLFLDKFSTTGIIRKTRGDLANLKQWEGESLMYYLERFKKTYDKIEVISQDTMVTCFEGSFKSTMLYAELQLGGAGDDQGNV